LCQGTKTVGVGAGQMSRVDSVNIACQKAGLKAGDKYILMPPPDLADGAKVETVS